MTPDPPTMSQFLRNTHLVPVLIICGGNALLMLVVPFVGDSRQRSEPRSALALLLQIAITATIAIFVAGMIAAVHAPSGH